MTFKENLDPNSNISSQSDGILESENSLARPKRGNSIRGKTLSKTICGRKGRFKVTGNSRVPLPEIMTSIARLISSQAVLEIDKTKQFSKIMMGCANLKFPKVFCKYNCEHRSNLISLLETRVSSGKSDAIIAKLGF
ncbi:hypothetical protein Goarm_022646 [Gossypium armourianum]|uniref:Uncharacterized protein n=1 Tax=Gossypium armourianum TaxID=34283 RepID=A0A7J9KH12_9ROSI|nr:hypothetical protein [Gossypium armourianum]